MHCERDFSMKLFDIRLCHANVNHGIAGDDMRPHDDRAVRRVNALKRIADFTPAAVP